MFKLTSEQLKDFQELGNIGAGNAASRLGEIIGRRVTIGLPQTVYSTLNDMKRSLGVDANFAVAIHVGATGDVQSSTFLMMRWAQVPILVHYLKKAASAAAGEETDIPAEFALKRMGETMSRAFSESINRFLMLSAKYTAPDMIVDSGSSVMDNVLKSEHGTEDNLLFISLDFSDPEVTFMGKLIHMLTPASQMIILNQLQHLGGAAK